ncbi:MAG: EcsC family protein [Archangiaceae bacterium]|nr:EcsC family protein [Archangiaceae bacterium]
MNFVNMDKHGDDEQQARKLLTAVERIVASSASIRATVEGVQATLKSSHPELKGDELRERVARALVKHYSDRAAIAGGASALPGLIPGWGSLVAALGGTVAELTFLLKWEVEMALALSHLYGFDIEAPAERQLAFLMASVGTYDAGGKNFFVDVLKLEGTAMWNYAPRRVARIVVQALAMLLARYVWRGFLKAIPVVGIVVGGSVNKLLTQKVGARCLRDVQTRRGLMRDQAREASAGARKKKPARRKAKKAPRREPPAETLN